MIIRIALVAAGIGIMWVEGLHQPSPGIGLAVAVVLILTAVLAPARRP